MGTSVLEHADAFYCVQILDPIFKRNVIFKYNNKYCAGHGFEDNCLFRIQLYK